MQIMTQQSVTTSTLPHPLLGGVAAGRGGFFPRTGGVVLRDDETHPAAYAAPPSAGLRTGLPRGDVFCPPPRKGVPFVRCRRAAATALTAAVMTIMSVAGIALTSDHTYLVYQRDVLRDAAGAATIATTDRLWELDPNLTEEEVEADLRPIARRYILANMPAGLRARVAETLELTPEIDRGAGTVDINAKADLGGVIFGSWMYGNPVTATQVGSKTERIEEDGITEVVLAIDITASMGWDLSGSSGTGEESRMDIVKGAALQLVDSLSVFSDSTAIGLVPWNFVVRLDEATRTRWEDLGWAKYPTQRYYPYPYRYSTVGESHTFPSKPEAWLGCVDHRDTSGVNPPGLSTGLPQVSPFTMGFYASIGPRLNSTRDTISYPCYHYEDISNPRYNKWCYDGPKENNPQFICETFQGGAEIVPLTTDTAKVRAAIEALPESGVYNSSTYSALGVVWSHRLLSPTWRTIWGDGNATHPVDLKEGTQKALVLLTDGSDSYLFPPSSRDSDPPDHETMTAHRNSVCTAAKNAGIKVFTVAAMSPKKVGTLGEELEKCSSKDDDPSGTYVFINNATPEAMSSAFQEIGQQLVSLRRTR